MVEWGSLLRSCLSNPWTVGSNPTLSANKPIQAIKFTASRTLLAIEKLLAANIFDSMGTHQDCKRNPGA